MKIIDCIQGEPEWHAARAGRVTASRVADIVRKTKTGVSASRNTYLGELVAERLSGKVAEAGFKSAAMQWGNDNEANAVALYELIHDCDCEAIGFALHPKIEMAGCSPDRLVNDAGLVEVKCPNTATHIATLLGAPIDPDYIKQIQWQLSVCERAWCDFVSFDPRLPAEMQIYVQRVPRDDRLIRELESAVEEFLFEVDNMVKTLNAKYRAKEAA